MHKNFTFYPTLKYNYVHYAGIVCAIYMIFMQCFYSFPPSFDLVIVFCV